MNEPYTSATNFMARVVPENPKCRGCLHYETNKSVCLTALLPQTCGGGDDPRLGYAPLAQLKPGDGHPTVGAVQAHIPAASKVIVAAHDIQPGPVADLTAIPIEVLNGEAPQLAAMMESATQAHLAKAERQCAIHSFGALSGTINPTLAFHKSDGDGCTCDSGLTSRFIHEFYKGLSPRFRYGYSEEAIGALLTSAYTAQLEKAARGPGSRGGKVLYYSKDGKPVYAGQVARHAEEAQQTMENWHHNAKRSNNPEDHAIAAKQAHHAAFFHHHNGDPKAAHEAMEHAHHHMGEYNKTGHKSKTTKWIKEHHEPVKKLTGFHSKEDDDLVNPHHASKHRGGGVPKPTHDETYDVKNYHHGKFHSKKPPKAEKSFWNEDFLRPIDKLLAKSKRTHKEIDALNKSMYGDDWLSPFQGTPFFEQAVKLCERDLELDEKQLKRREENAKREVARAKEAAANASSSDYENIWIQRDRVAHDKRKLMLKLAQHSAAASKKRSKAYKQLDAIKSFSDPDLIKYVVTSAHPPKGTNVPHGSVVGAKTAQGSNKTSAGQNVLQHVPGKGKGVKDKKKLKKDWYGGGQQPAQPRSTPQQQSSVDNAVRAAGQRAASEAMASHAQRAPKAPQPQMAQKSEPRTFSELFKGKKEKDKKKREGKGYIPGVIH